MRRFNLFSSSSSSSTHRRILTISFNSSPRFTNSSRFCSTTTTTESSSSSSSKKSGSAFQYRAGRAAGILLPFVAVWMGSSYLFPQPQQPTGEIVIIQPGKDNNNDDNEGSTPASGTSLGGPFKLIDCETKKEVTDKEIFSCNKNLKDEEKMWSMLYFGFSKCAEVCPRNLKFMADAIENLSNVDDGDAAKWKKNVQIVFVSVDPIRDKPDVLEKYLKEKLPADKGIKWRGLVGDQEAISSVCQAWRVYYSSLNESDEEREAREAVGMSLEEALGKNNENYQLDHSAAVYFLAPGGKLRDLFFDEMGVKHASDRIDLHMSGSYSGLNKV